MRDSAGSVDQLVPTWTLDQEVVGLKPTLYGRSCLKKGSFIRIA